MTVAIASNIASPRAALDEAVISVTGLPVNDSTDYDANRYPTEAALVYRFLFDSPGATTQYDMTSQAFTPDSAGVFNHLPITFPVAGSWSIKLYDNHDNLIATQAITIA